MIESVRAAFSLPDLRKRILFTIAMLAIYRLVANIPVPGVDLEAWLFYIESGQGGGLIEVLNLLSGGAVSNFSVMAMGVYPYITASIIIQLLTPIIPYFSELSAEGESGVIVLTEKQAASLDVALFQVKRDFFHFDLPLPWPPHPMTLLCSETGRLNKLVMPEIGAHTSGRRNNKR